MRERKQLLIPAGVVLAVATLGVVMEVGARNERLARLARGRLIDEEHCDRIKVGMRQEEVEAILGGPPGSFTPDSVIYITISSFSMWDGRERWEYWSGNEGQIEVAFDEQGAVQFSTFSSGLVLQLPPPTLIERLGDWLRPRWP
jgi:outer membrane protein assembly factor BamE (lipoprotein component of BamABCDE complex)